jgi:hypothetical protein
LGINCNGVVMEDLEACIQQGIATSSSHLKELSSKKILMVLAL